MLGQFWQLRALDQSCFTVKNNITAERMVNVELAEGPEQTVATVVAIA